MDKKTYISQVIEGNADKVRYEAEVKKVLSDKTILAWIMKYTMEEFKDCAIATIRECIEGEPEIGTMHVRPGHTPEAIAGMNTEDKVPGEGEITYDIRFSAVTPDKERVKLIINVEAQKNYYPGYDLVTRAIFYCARMLSAQLDTEFIHGNYKDIKKVYSIWICMDAPRYAENTIMEYRLDKRELYGHLNHAGRYDLMSAVMIGLGSESNMDERNPLNGMLSTLFSERLTPKEKIEKLSKEYDIETSVEIKEGMRLMCNLSDRIEEKGIAQGIEQGIEQGLAALVATLKPLLPDIQAVLEAIRKNEAYAEVTEEQVRKYF